MRILIATGIYPPDIGGPATYSLLLEKEFPKRGVEVKILSFGWYTGYPKIIRHFLYFFKVIRLGFSTDIIYAQDSVSAGFPAVLAAKLLRKKFAIKIVGDYAWEQGIQRFGANELLDEFLEKRHGFFVELLKKIERYTTRRADLVIVPSNYLLSVVGKWGVNKNKIKVVYNVVSLNSISKLEARERLGVKNDETILFSAGREVPWKGFSMLREINIEGAKMVIGTFPKDKYELWLSACDIFLMNTGYEGFSHQLLEAMALGKPIITTDAGGNKEIAENEKNTLIVEYNDKEAWIVKINTLLGNKELQKTLSENAKITAQKFLSKDMIGETIKVLENIK